MLNFVPSVNMDPERQPLISPQGVQYGSGDVRCRRYRPLTTEEVQTSRQEVSWRRARFFVVIMFWAIMAMFLSSIATLLIQTEEAQSSRQEVSWRRARFFVVIMFWAIMAMFLSSIATLLIQAPRCPTLTPSVAPVHLNFAPLINGMATERTSENSKFEFFMA